VIKHLQATVAHNLRVVVAGTSGITSTSGDLVLNRSDNVFAVAVTVAGKNVSLGALNNLTLAEATVRSNLTVTSGGNLVFGPTSVDGNLSAKTAGGSITQTGAILVMGKAIFDAGDGAIDLSNPYNYFLSGVDTNGSSVLITGDPNAVSRQTSAGAFYQQSITGEFAPVMVSDSFCSGIVTRDVLVVTESDEQQIKMSLCMSSPVSANLTCVSD